MKERDWMVGIALVVALAAGLGTGYLHWGWPTNWYARDVTSLPASPENDIIRYGHSLIVDTSKHIGKAASDLQKRYAGNDLACVNCHLDAGLRPFAAPFVSTFATFPMLVDDQVITLKDRINGGVRYLDPVLSEQQAWDVAAFMISKPRPPAPPEAESELR